MDVLSVQCIQPELCDIKARIVSGREMMHPRETSLSVQGFPSLLWMDYRPSDLDHKEIIEARHT